MARGVDPSFAPEGLLDAVRRRGAVRMQYGEVPGWRLVVPLAVTRSWPGELYLVAEQVSGASRSGLLGRAKTSRLDRVRRLRPVPGVFACFARSFVPDGYVEAVLAARPDLAVPSPNARTLSG